MRIFLIAGEASGDRLGAALMAGLQELAPGVSFAGVGGPQMQARGMTSLYPMDELSVMGLAEVLPRYRNLRRRIAQTAQAALDWAPDTVITIDSPDFCLRVARQVRQRAHPRMIHYVAPSVWAWRPGRAARMARHIDHVLALLPFEPPYMRAAGMGCDFVGHPVVAEPAATAAEIAELRRAEGLGPAPLLAVLPGSRRSETARLAPVFGAALAPVLEARPQTRVIVPAAPGQAAALAAEIARWPGRPVILDADALPAAASEARKRAALAAADLALAASGTVSLELCAARTPMVIGYDMHRLSWLVMSRMARVDTVTLANLVTETRTIPEFLGPRCRPEPIARALLALAENEEARAGQLRVMEQTMQALGAGGEPPGLRAARAVLAAL